MQMNMSKKPTVILFLQALAEISVLLRAFTCATHFHQMAALQCVSGCLKPSACPVNFDQNHAADIYAPCTD